LNQSALYISAPLAHLFNISLASSYVPPQWKTASILPVPKTNPVISPSDLRPISLTPILSRLMEKYIVKEHITPILLQPTFNSQFAFKPTGSTTAALIAITSFVSRELERVPYVRCFALDFSKAFDRVSHGALFEKLATYNLPVNIYNWLQAFFTNRSHSTCLNSTVSSCLPITASVVQGSALGPPVFVLNGTDLKPMSSANYMPVYADDTYLLVPSDNESSIQDEFDAISAWATKNNIPLNRQKCNEIIFHKPRTKISAPSITVCGTIIPRVVDIKILGVTFTDTLSVSPHVREVTADCKGRLYALSVLRRHGLDSATLDQIFVSLVLNKILYASPAWSGYMSAADQASLQAIVNKGVRWGLAADLHDIATLMSAASSTLFHQILNNHNHSLYHLLPPIKQNSYNLRPRAHSHLIPRVSTRLNSCSFISRMLAKDSY